MLFIVLQTCALSLLPICTFSSYLDITVSSPPATAISHSYTHPSVAVNAGSNLVMHCSSPEDAVRWNERSSNKLELSDVRSSDVGLYTCCEYSNPGECSSVHLFVRNDWVSAGLISRSRRKIEDSGFGVKFDPTVGFSLQRATWTEEWWTLKCTTLSGGSDAVDVVIYWTVASDLVPVPEIDSSVSEPKNRHSSKPHEIKVADIRYDPIQVNTELEGNVVVGVGENITLSGFYEDPVNCSHRSYVWKKIRKTGNLRVAEMIPDHGVHVVETKEQNFTRIRLSKANVQNSDSGVYELLLQSCGRNGSVSFSVAVTEPEAHVNDAQITAPNFVVLVLTLVFVGLSLCIVLSIWIWINQKLAHDVQVSPIKSSAGFYDGSYAYKKQLRMDGSIDGKTANYKSIYTGRIIPGTELLLEPGIIGKGAYGYVSKAKLHDREVAVKRLKSGERKEHEQNLIEELAVIEYLQSSGKHENIVAMIGAVFDPAVMIVFEFCPKGNLISFLKTVQYSTRNTAFAMRISKCLNTSNQGYYNFGNDVIDKPLIYQTDLLSYASQISSALQFLSSRKVIHRDVAARNVLVVSVDRVKLCDFGLSKNCNYDDNFEYRTPGTKPLPFKWMSPESLEGSFTTKSDVWAFGVFVWEIFELGKAPYVHTNDPEDLLSFLRAGGRLSRPAEAPVALYQLMQRLWSHAPDDRPHFDEISAELHHISGQVRA